jgi:Type I phosphodiesterase / nucleotide pyrophosphatase
MRIPRIRPSFALAIFTSLAAIAIASCTAARNLVLTGGEIHPTPAPHQNEPGPHVLIFGFDGAGYNQLNEAIASGRAPNLAALLGKPEGGGVYDHAYSAPQAETIFPAITAAAWSVIFTGEPSAYTSIPGNEWFAREQMQFYAPIPVSVPQTGDVLKMVGADLIGKQLTAPTLYEQAGVSSGVSLNMVYRGADTFTTVAPTTFVALVADYLAGATGGVTSRREVYSAFDQDSINKLISAFDKQGIPRLQTVYFPGIDLYTHVAPGDPLRQEVEYLEQITDPLVGKVIAEYKSRGLLSNTYVLIIADHGHTPVLNDSAHALAMDPNTGPDAVLKSVGFRPRPFVLDPSSVQQDYQAVLAYEDSIAYVYLADRSTCPNVFNKCDWTRPPRFDEDVMPVARAFYEANRTGKGAPRLKGTLDLIFARRPVPKGSPTNEYEVFDGKGLVPIAEYLEDHPHPDLLDLDRRMRWLTVGPHGNRSGDVLLLARIGLTIPIQQRYYFAHLFHSVHGSASVQDAHIPLILSHEGCAGSTLKSAMEHVTGERPTVLQFTPLVLELLGASGHDEICGEHKSAPAERIAAHTGASK